MDPELGNLVNLTNLSIRENNIIELPGRFYILFFLFPHSDIKSGERGEGEAGGDQIYLKYSRVHMLERGKGKIPNQILIFNHV